MNIETLNNVIGNALNRVITRAIDSIGALPVGSKYSFAASNPFTLLVQRDAFADYPTVIFQDVKTGKDFASINDVSNKTKEKLIDAIKKHIQKTGPIPIEYGFNEKLTKDTDQRIKKFVNNIIGELREEKRGKSKSTKKTTSKRVQKRDTKINPDKSGFLVRKTTEGFKNEPKSKFTIYKNEKIPGVKFFVGKVDGMWYVYELMSGKSIASGFKKTDTIKEADRVISKFSSDEIKKKIKENRLPKEQLDIVMAPYKLYSKSKVSKTTTPKKQTVKKTVKAKPKEVSSSIETCSDAGRILRIKKTSAAGRKLAVCRWK